MCLLVCVRVWKFPYENISDNESFRNARYKMIKIILLLFLIFNSIIVFCQSNQTNVGASILSPENAEGFENDGTIPEGWILSNTGCFIDNVSREGGNWSIGLKENGYLISPKAPEGKNIGKIVFWYSPAQLDDDYQIVIEYENEKGEWLSLTVLVQCELDTIRII